ncbi:unnamed protein product [Paramecium primaurelia]|uniref:Mitochondrial carrier protein n=1 Tax=Paramecium primaurelia TaxID=5886 RepID=A0A8S1Q7X1_PARPR|nr:unnamed protein product [Paramecium primaurelia]
MNDDTLIIRITTYSSMFAGIIGKIACHPIDTIRAKIQIRQTMMLKIKAEKLISTLAKETLRTEGLRGLYKGLGITIIGTGPAYSLYLTTYETSKYLLNQLNFMKDSPNLISFVSGMMAETISCIFWLPIDVIKERLQVQSNIKVFDYKNTFDAIQKILRSEGVVGLYRAYGATVASYGPFSAFYFMFYEKLKTILENPLQPSFLESLCLSGIAGSMAGFICNPMDIVRLRMQVQRASVATHADAGNFGYKNLIHGLYKVVKNEGILSLTKGSMAKVLYTCPNTAISMSVAEVTRSYFINKYKSH